MTTRKTARRSMLSGIGAAAAAVAIGSTRTDAQTQAAFQPARHPQDEWLGQVPGRHRNVIDCASAASGSQGLFYASNILESNRSGYQLTDRDVAIVICLRHLATVFAFNDAMWAKYGKAMADFVHLPESKTKEPPTRNPLEASDVTISELVPRGVQFAVCNMATHGASEIIAGAMKLDAAAVYNELIANLIPNSHLMASGVLAINRAQEYGYTLLTAV